MTNFLESRLCSFLAMVFAMGLAAVWAYLCGYYTTMGYETYSFIALFCTAFSVCLTLFYLALWIVPASNLRWRYTRNGGMRFFRIHKLQISWTWCRKAL